MKFYTTLFSLLFCFSAIIQAEVRLHNIFSDNMVLQRDKTIKIWGWADKGESVQISFAGQTKKGKADKNGKWSLSFDPIAHGGPYVMSVKGNKNSLELKNILIGDVWLCSGQSNMEMSVNGWGQVYDYQDEIRHAKYPNIRSFNVEKNIGISPQEDVKGQWEVCSPQTVSDFSAVAYFFARKLNQELNIPIGIINSSWGGTDIETWISPESFAKLPTNFSERYADLKGKDLNLVSKNNDINKQAFFTALGNDQSEKEQWYKETATNPSEWEKVQIPEEWATCKLRYIDGVAWFRYTFNLPQDVEGKPAKLSLGAIDDNDVTWINNTKVGETEGYNIPREYSIPSGTLKAGNNLLSIKVTDGSGGGGLFSNANKIYIEVQDTKYPLAGEWEYKPSTTSDMYNYIEFGPNSYSSLLYNGMIYPITQLAIKGAIWYQGENNAADAVKYQTMFPTMIQDWRNIWKDEIPFYWVQLASYMAKDEKPTKSDWAELREAQDMTLSLSKTGQAVITDIGDAEDIHPRNKQDVGLRLALIALNKDYGRNKIVYSGPRFKSMEISGNKAIISYDFIADGLLVKNKYGYIEGFTIAGADNNFVWAKAYLKGNQVIVESDAVTKPVAVRYSWANNPDVNLFNSEGLPAVPFRTDK